MTDTANLIAWLDDVADALECFGEDKHPADIRKEAARDIRDAIDTIERLSQQEAGYIEQHGRDSAELRRLCGERDFERDLRASMAVELKEARIEIAGNEQRIAALESELAALANQEPAAWAIRVGDSDTWSYAGSESDADFYCKQSGLKCEKRPLFAHQPAATAREGVIRFAGLVLKEHRNDGYPGDIDGDFLQQAAIECGLIEERTVTEPCGENCSCAEVTMPADFPTTCYFNTEAGRAAISAAEKEQKT